MANSRTETGNIQNEPSASNNARAWGSTQIKTMATYVKGTQQLTENPSMARTIWVTKCKINTLGSILIGINYWINT